MSTVWQDLRYAVRTLRRGWLVTAAAMASLALAIGGNAAVFSMVDAFIFRPLPYAEPDRVVIFGEREKDQPENSGALSTSLATYADLVERSRTMATWGAIRPRTLSLRGSERSEAVSGVAVTPSFFDVMRVSAWRGRTFLQEEGVEGARRVALLSHEYWIRSYGETEDPLSRTLTLNGEPHEIVGILPEGFEFLTPNQDVWIPLAQSATASPRDQRNLFAAARMLPGSTMDQVRSEMRTLAGQLETEFPETMRNWTVDSYNFRYDIPTSQTRLLFALLQGSVFLVLVIACVNVTNLLLARGQERSREIALRTVLGAGRLRIVRQLFTESSVMVLAAAAAGMALGALGIRLLGNQFAGLLPAQFQIVLDYRVLAFTALISATAGLLFGLAPALQAFKQRHVEALKEGGRSGRSASKKMLSRVLVVAEIALSFVALGGGSLLVRSFLDLRDTDPGFETSQILTTLVTVPDSRFPGDEERLIFADRMVEAALGISGATAATITNSLPQNFQVPTDSFRIAGAEVDGGVPAPTAMTIKATPGYLETLDLGLVQGRFFEESDRLGTAPVVVVSRALAAARFEGRGALGEGVELDGATREIVGVVDDIQHVAFQAQVRTNEAIYLPVGQVPEGARWIMLRTTSDPMDAKESLRIALEGLDPDLSTSQMRTMDEFVAQFFVGVNVFNTVLAGFGLMALLLASLGTYGVLAYSVSQRSHEIGVRMAVGARPREVVRMIARQGVTLGIIGLAIGGLMTVPLIGLLNTVLQGLSTVKPLTLVLIGGVLFAVTMVASLVPARRAAGVDPVRTLREE